MIVCFLLISVAEVYVHFSYLLTVAGFVWAELESLWLFVLVWVLYIHDLELEVLLPVSSLFVSFRVLHC